MLKKKERVKGKVVSLLDNGAGVIYKDRDRILVRNVLLNEVVEVEIEKRIREGYVGNVVSFIEPSKNRKKPLCKSYYKCGSCHLLHASYKHQLEIKKKLTEDLIQKSRLKNIKVHDCIGMDKPYEYRNKIIISFGKNKKEMVAGFYEEFSHRIIPIQNCLMHEEYTNTLIEDLKKIVKKCRIEPYEEDYDKGYLRHILIRRGVVTNETMLVLVVKDRVFKAKSQFLDEIKRMHPEINTVVLNVNKRRTSVVLGDEEHILFGKGYIEDILCGLKFKISSKSFYQINHEQCEKLYEKALDLLALKKNEVVIDAYCGVGTIGCIVSKNAKQVYSVEINKDAVKDAILNAKSNNIDNIRFVCEDAGKYMVQQAKACTKIDAVIMDPARDGSDENFLSSLVKLNPKKVVYISCNPKTQIRDLEYLSKCGYKIKEMYIYDLFPNTFHVESVCLIVKK